MQYLSCIILTKTPFKIYIVHTLAFKSSFDNYQCVPKTSSLTCVLKIFLTNVIVISPFDFQHSSVTPHFKSFQSNPCRYSNCLCFTYILPYTSHTQFQEKNSSIQLHCCTLIGFSSKNLYQPMLLFLFILCFGHPQ